MRQALARIIDGTQHVQQDMAMEARDQHFVSLSDEEREQVKDGYVWLDWSSIPQKRGAFSGERGKLSGGCSFLVTGMGLRCKGTLLVRTGLLGTCF